MKFSAKEDIEAPIERVFAVLSDFDIYERAALRRGAEVQRTDRLPAPGQGMQWQTKFRFRGKERAMTIEMTSFTPPTGMHFLSQSPGFEGAMAVDLVALSRARTRVAIDMVVTPKNLTSRLLMQSMKLAKGSVERKFTQRVAEFATDIENRAQRMG